MKRDSERRLTSGERGDENEDEGGGEREDVLSGDCSSARRAHIMFAVLVKSRANLSDAYAVLTAIA